MSIKTTVKDILSHKNNNQVISIGPHELVFDALRQMALHNVGALLVIEFGRVVGIVSERDYARKVILQNRSSRTTKVHEIMESEVLYVIPRDSAESCMALMTERRIRHLPVFEHGRLVGVVSIGDIVKAVNEDNEFMIEQLIQYTTGSYTAHSAPPGMLHERVSAEIRVL